MKNGFRDYQPYTSTEQVKVIRHLVVSARRVLWDMDEAKSDDPVFANPYHVDEEAGAGMNPSVARVQSSLEQVLYETAEMLDMLRAPDALDDAEERKELDTQRWP